MVQERWLAGGVHEVQGGESRCAQEARARAGSAEPAEGAQLMRPPFDVDLIDALTPHVIAAGELMLQTHCYAGSHDAHVRLLLSEFRLPPGALVVDMGAGL